MKFLLIIFCLILGGLSYSQSFELDTFFLPSKRYQLDFPQKIGIRNNGDFIVAGDISNAQPSWIAEYSYPSYNLDNGFNPNQFYGYVEGLDVYGDTILVRSEFYIGIGNDGHENMVNYHLKQQEEQFVTQNIHSPDYFFDNNTKKLYGICSDYFGNPCINGYPGQFSYRLNSDGSIDTSFHHVLDNGIKNIKRINNNRILITGSFTSYDNVNRNGLAFIDNEGELLPEIASFYSNNEPLRIVAQDTSGYTLLLGNLQINSETENYTFVRIDSLGVIDTSFHYKLFPYDPTQNFSTAIYFQNRIIIGGNFDEFYGYERNGILALKKNGEIDTVLFKTGFTSVFYPSLGILPGASQIISWGNNIYILGNFSSYENKSAAKIARLIYVPQNENPEPSVYNEIIAYPTPLTNSLTIEGVKYSEYLLFNSNGQLIKQFSLEDTNKKTFEIDVSSGYYFLKQVNYPTIKPIIIKN